MIVVLLLVIGIMFFFLSVHFTVERCQVKFSNYLYADDIKTTLEKGNNSSCNLYHKLPCTSKSACHGKKLKFVF